MLKHFPLLTTFLLAILSSQWIRVYYPSQLSLVRRHGWMNEEENALFSTCKPFGILTLKEPQELQSDVCLPMQYPYLKDTFSILMFSGSQTGWKWAPLSYISLRVPKNTYRHQAMLFVCLKFFLLGQSGSVAVALPNLPPVELYQTECASATLSPCCQYDVAPVGQGWCVHPKVCCFVKLKIMNSQMNNITIYSSLTLYIILK